MSRSEAEKILGAPKLELNQKNGAQDAYYGPPPSIKPWESPYSPFCICIHYSEHGAVERKEFVPNSRPVP